MRSLPLVSVFVLCSFPIGAAAQTSEEARPTASFPETEPARPVASEQSASPTPEAGPTPAPYSGLTAADRVMIGNQIDDIADQRDDKYSLGGPIALIAVGGGVVIGGLVFAAYGALFRSIDYTGTLDEASRVMIIGGLGAAVLGTGALTGGLVWLPNQIKKRRPYNERIDELENQLEYGFLTVSPLLLRGGAGLSVYGAWM